MGYYLPLLCAIAAVCAGATATPRPIGGWRQADAAVPSYSRPSTVNCSTFRTAAALLPCPRTLSRSHPPPPRPRPRPLPSLPTRSLEDVRAEDRPLRRRHRRHLPAALLRVRHLVEDGGPRRLHHRRRRRQQQRHRHRRGGTGPHPLLHRERVPSGGVHQQHRPHVGAGRGAGRAAGTSSAYIRSLSTTRILVVLSRSSAD